MWKAEKRHRKNLRTHRLYLTRERGGWQCTSGVVLGSARGSYVPIETIPTYHILVARRMGGSRNTIVKANVGEHRYARGGGRTSHRDAYKLVFCWTIVLFECMTNLSKGMT